MAINGDDNDRIFDIFDGDNAVLHPTTISGLSFEHGFADIGDGGDGGAIRSTESLILKNTVFSNNYAYLGGGAIHLDTKGKLSIASSTFLNNTALNGNGGAVYGQADGGISIVKSLVSGNTAPDLNGGGLYLLVPSSTGKPAGILVDGVTFLRNSAESGGGLWADVNQAKGKIIVKNSTFTDNGVTSSGGGLYLNNGPATVSGSTFSNNVAGTDGGGLASNATNPLTTLTIKGSRFEGNAATGNGGAIHLRHEVLASTRSLPRRSALDSASAGTPRADDRHAARGARGSRCRSR